MDLYSIENHSVVFLVTTSLAVCYCICRMHKFQLGYLQAMGGKEREIGKHTCKRIRWKENKSAIHCGKFSKYL